MLKKIVKDGSFVAKGVWGLFSAKSAGDNSVVLLNQDGSEIKRLEFLRQQRKLASGIPNLSLSDFISDEEDDYMGMFAVSILGAQVLAEEYEKDHDDYHAIMVKVLADRLAEAFAELLHERIRTTYWGYKPSEKLVFIDHIQPQPDGFGPKSIF